MTATPKILMRRCATCDDHFEHAEGGACVNCERVFCSEHLHGPWGWWRRRRKGYQPVCRECRKQ